MLSDWWNGVELWISGLPFPFQFALVIAVLAPVCLVVAWLIDRIVDNMSAWFGPSDTGARPLASRREAEDPIAEDQSADESTAGDETPERARDEDRVPAESSGR